MNKKKKVIILIGCLIILTLVFIVNLSYADSGWDTGYGSGGYSGGYSSSDYEPSSYSGHDSGGSGIGSAIFYAVIFIIACVSFIASQIALAQHKKNVKDINKKLDSMEDMDESEINKYISNLSKEQIKYKTISIYEQFIKKDIKVCTDELIEKNIDLKIKEITEFVDINIIKVSENKDITLYLIYKYKPEDKDVELFDQVIIDFIYDKKTWKINNIERI